MTSDDANNTIEKALPTKSFQRRVKEAQRQEQSQPAPVQTQEEKE